MIAHRTEDGREQSIAEHLHGTADRAKDFAKPFGAEEMAYTAGLAHDIGKYSAAFQRRIRGSAQHCDHATAGAQELLKRGNLWAAYCVAGHHGGIPDGGAQSDAPGAPTLWGRLKRVVEPYGAFSKEIMLPSQPMFRKPTLFGNGGFTVSFLTRMLYSCLVDADFLDTEAFMQGAAPLRGKATDMDELLMRLESYIAPWWDAKTALNRARCDILQACREAGAREESGLFTLTVPTGGGKTVSSLAFALHHAKAHGKKRVVYVVPFVNIIEQTADTFRRILGSENVLEHHANVDFDDESDPNIECKKLATENWDMPIIVTTAVQFFESLFSNKPSRCRKLHNLADSVIIFDEAQSIPLPYLRPCVRAIAELSVNYGASCVLCTATQPALEPLLQEVSPDLSLRELAPLIDRGLFRRVRYVSLGQVTDEELAAALNAHEQVLCIVGTRKQAQALYHLLDREGSFHLSTLMTPYDRRRVLADIRTRLQDGRPCRVVATSLIEAGVDVDFPTVYRAEAGLDSEIQAAGRCNREGKRAAADSLVYLFRPESAYTATLPHSLKRPMEVTREVLAKGGEHDDDETIRCYFTTLYHVSGDSLDVKKILPRLEANASEGSYPFATVAKDVQLIDSNTRTVFVPCTEQGREIAARLRQGQRSRSLLRQVGQQSVNVYEQHFLQLFRRGALEVLDESMAILTDLSLYHDETGLTLLCDSGIGIFA